MNYLAPYNVKRKKKTPSSIHIVSSFPSDHVNSRAQALHPKRRPTIILAFYKTNERETPALRLHDERGRGLNQSRTRMPFCFCFSRGTGEAKLAVSILP